MKVRVEQFPKFTLIDLSLEHVVDDDNFQHYTVSVRPTGSEISLFLRDKDEARKLANQILSAIEETEE
tara:strand:- start:1778 stop:1981 length:204 start_codon:yes stop_codon:yes gene_type:complete